MLCAKFNLNWTSGSGEDFLNFIYVFSIFCNYLPLEKDVTLHLNKLEFFSPNDALWQVLLKLVQLFWRRCLNFVNVFFGISLLSPLRNGRDHLFEQVWMSFTKGWFLLCLFEINTVVLEKTMFDFVNVLLLFHFYIPLEIDGTIDLKKFKSLWPKAVLCQV